MPPPSSPRPASCAPRRPSHRQSSFAPELILIDPPAADPDWEWLSAPGPMLRWRRRSSARRSRRDEFREVWTWVHPPTRAFSDRHAPPVNGILYRPTPAIVAGGNFGLIWPILLIEMNPSSTSLERFVRRVYRRLVVLRLLEWAG